MASTGHNADYRTGYTSLSRSPSTVALGEQKDTFAIWQIFHVGPPNQQFAHDCSYRYEIVANRCQSALQVFPLFGGCPLLPKGQSTCRAYASIIIFFDLPFAGKNKRIVSKVCLKICICSSLLLKQLNAMILGCLVHF